MPKEVKVDFGPKFQQYLQQVQALADTKIEVGVNSEDPELQAAAYAAEYGASGSEEQPFMRPAMNQLKGEMGHLLKHGSIEALEARAQELVQERVEQNVTDPKLAADLSQSIETHVVE